MLSEDKESFLLDTLRMHFKIPDGVFYFEPKRRSLLRILETVCDEADWTDSSGKADLPPDFYNDKARLMLEVMRIDDHAHKIKGKLRNPNLERQRNIEKELNEIGIMNKFPNARLVINAVTDLPTGEDHSYKFYLDNFKRTVEKHIKQIPNYRNNHKGYKLIFLVFDESSPYFEAENENVVVEYGKGCYGRIHLWFCDKSFIEEMVNKDIDYFIWFTPYKYFEPYNEPEKLPNIAVFDCKRINMKRLIDYKFSHMKSIEE